VVYRDEISVILHLNPGRRSARVRRRRLGTASSNGDVRRVTTKVKMWPVASQDSLSPLYIVYPRSLQLL